MTVHPITRLSPEALAFVYDATMALRIKQGRKLPRGLQTELNVALEAIYAALFSGQVDTLTIAIRLPAPPLT